MEKQKVDVTNTSPKIAALLLIFIAMNTCVSNVYQELSYDIQQEQLKHAKKQYTLDSLQYVHDTTLYNNMVRFHDEYMKTAKKQQYTDSLLGVSADVLGREFQKKTKQTQEIFEYTKRARNQR
jgi:hypothetical protein